MEPSINDKRTIVQQEFMRRQSQLGASSAGIGAETTNNPQSGMPREAMTNPPQIQGGAAGTQSDGMATRMKTEKGESRVLIDAMINRLKKLTERGE